MDNWRATTSTNKLSACDLWKWSEKWSTAAGIIIYCFREKVIMAINVATKAKWNAVRRRCRYCNSYQSVTIWIQIMPYCLAFCFTFVRHLEQCFFLTFSDTCHLPNPLFWVVNFSILSYCFGFILHFLYWFDIIWDCNHFQKTCTRCWPSFY